MPTDPLALDLGEIANLPIDDVIEVLSHAEHLQDRLTVIIDALVDRLPMIVEAVASIA